MVDVNFDASPRCAQCVGDDEPTDLIIEEESE
jgi:hypothetical protein